MIATAPFYTLSGEYNMSYFSFKEIDRGIYRISEAKGVNEYVVTGSDKALLIDTGYGHKGMVKYIRQNITDLPLTVINTHYHPDHSAGNCFFDSVYIGKNDMPMPGEKSDFEILIGKLRPILGKVICLVFKEINPNACEYIPVQSGFTFDLGHRSLTVHDFPGHTKGSILIEDRLTRTLFTGDACNTGTWLFTNPEQNMAEYAGRVKALSDEYSHIEKVLFSHSSDSFKPSFFSEYADMLKNLDVKKAKKIKPHGFDDSICIYFGKLPSFGKAGIIFFKGQMEK